jgi:hypothetical protein
MTADVHEWNNFAVDLGKAGVRMVPKARLVLAKTLADGTRDAQAFCPVDTGNLRSSIGWEMSGLEGEFGPTAEYGAYVEEGTSTMAPHGYVGPAFDRVTPGFIEATAALAEVVM